MLFAFQVILSAIAGNVPIAAKKVPTYRAPGVLVLIRTMNPVMPTANTLAFILWIRLLRNGGHNPRAPIRSDSHAHPIVAIHAHI